MCKPTVYRSRFGEWWTWDCEEHEETDSNYSWTEVMDGAHYHRYLTEERPPIPWFAPAWWRGACE